MMRITPYANDTGDTATTRRPPKPTLPPGALDVALAPIEAQTANLDLSAPSKDYMAMADYWQQVQDIIDGEKCIIKAGMKYLPKFPHEEIAGYNFRLSVAQFPNVYADILDSLAAKPFEQEIQLVKTDNDKAINNKPLTKGDPNNETDPVSKNEIKIPDAVKEFVENVDGSGNNITQFGSNTFYRGINAAIDWIFVDYPDRNMAVANPDIVLSVEAEKQLGLRPFWRHILAINVLEVRSELIGSTEKITYFRVFEPGNGKTKNRIRLMQSDGQGSAVWELFEETDTLDPVTNRKYYTRISSGVFSIGEIPIVPFITGRREGTSWVFQPPMRGAADMQMALYRKQSGLNYAITMAGHPMFAANGVKPDLDANDKPKPVITSPGYVLYAPPHPSGQNGEWVVLNADSAVLTFLQGEVEKTEQRLRELGKQPLTAQSGNLTVITTAVAASKARSAVGAWALSLQDALENAMVFTCMFLGISQDQYDPELSVYTDFDQFTDNATDITALVAARAKGDISQETFLYELKRRRILSPDFDFEAELERILSETPSGDELSGYNTPPKPGGGPKPGDNLPPNNRMSLS